MKLDKRVAVLIAAALLVLLFSLADFRVAYSSDRNEKESTKTSMGQGLPYMMESPSTLALSVTGGGALAPALKNKLVNSLQGSEGIAEIKVLPDLVEKTGEPYLMARVIEKQVFWTPFFARSRIVVETGFGSNGSVAHIISDQPAFYNSSEGPGVHSYAKYTLTDTSFGLISYRGYYSLLADQLALAIREATTPLYQPLQ